VSQWESLADPVVLAQQMWNHGPAMREAFAKRKLAWGRTHRAAAHRHPGVPANLPETKALRTTSCSRPPIGPALFQSKGCAGCHVGKLALETRLRNQTLTEIAVDMWNHQPSMKNPAAPAFPGGNAPDHRLSSGPSSISMADGNAEAAEKVFAEKNCATCTATLPPAAATGKGKARSLFDITMLSPTSGSTAPRMLESMNQRNLAWPRFTAQQMAEPDSGVFEFAVRGLMTRIPEHVRVQNQPETGEPHEHERCAVDLRCSAFWLGSGCISGGLTCAWLSTSPRA